MVTHSTATPPPSDPGKKVVEERLKPSLIRRRAKTEVVAPPEPSELCSREGGVAGQTGSGWAGQTGNASITSPVGGATCLPAGTARAPVIDVSQAASTSATATAPTRTATPTIRAGMTPPAKAGVVGAAARPAIPHGPLRPGGMPGRPSEAVDLRKPARRKKSKEEWVVEDIKRAGGLKQFVYVADLAPGEEPPAAEAATEAEAPVAVAASVVNQPHSGGEGEAPPALPVEGATRAPGIDTPDRIERVFQPSGRRRKKPMRREFRKTVVTRMSPTKRVIRIEEQISVADLSQAMGVKGNALIQKLFQLGTMVTINQAVDVDTASLLAQEFGFEIERAALNEEKIFAGKTVAGAGVLRPPVVTVMGHVDHGKTSILDAVRSTKVADGEAGGITQHIGASEVQVPKKGIPSTARDDRAGDVYSITFIDTPGHAAFTELRARGARVTDVVVLVVAADDGVMPQTKEAIDHAKAAGVPIIVAVNKMDRPDANPDRVKRELSENGLVPEEWGGDVICVPTSAKSRLGIDHLLEMILLQAELQELKADPTAPARGTVIEARLDRGRGPVATVIVQNGTLRPGASLVCGTAAGRVRALIDPQGQAATAIGPGHAAEILGLDSVPAAGDQFVEATDEKGAKLVVESRMRKQRDSQLAKSARVSLEDLHRQIETGEVKSLNVIVKADVQGSAEAVADALGRIGTAVAKVHVLHRGVGGITESDVLLAAASQAVIIGFNVVAERSAAKLAEQERVEIKRYTIIYELLDHVKKALEGLLAPTLSEKVLGRAEVRQVFNITKIGTIAGSQVVSGKVQRNAQARLLRDSVVVYQGKFGSLRRFKDDAREVPEGMECGIGLENFQDIKPGDIIECFIIEETATTL